MVVGTICAILHGAGLPMLMIVFGDMVDLFVGNSITHRDLDTVPWAVYNTTKDEAVDDLEQLE